MTQLADIQIAPAEGKLGVLISGMGAVTTTFLAGLEAIKRRLKEKTGASRLAMIWCGSTEVFHETRARARHPEEF